MIIRYTMTEYFSNYVVVMGKYKSTTKLYTFTYDELRDFLLDHICESDDQTPTLELIRRAIRIGESRIHTNKPMDDEYGVLAVISGKIVESNE